MDAKEQKRKRERERYARMTNEEKKARIKQVTAKPEMKRSTQTKHSIAMENLGFIGTDMSPKVTPSTHNVKYRKHVTLGDTQALLAHNNKKKSLKD